MAVGHALLGRNVRCPHCKQVTRAPAAAGQAPLPPPAAQEVTPPPPRPIPKFNLPKDVEHPESIFGERHDEDVFGSNPPKPTLVMPSPPIFTPPPSDERPAVVAPVKAPTPTPPIAPMQADPLVFDTPLKPEPGELGDESPALKPPPRPSEPRRITVQEQAPPTQAFAWIMLAYAAVATALAGFFGYQYFTAGSKGDHPFQAIPDFYGQYEKANRKQVSFNGMPDPKLDVPANLRVKLGETLTVGDLEVTPTAVTRQRLTAVTVPVTGDTKVRETGGKATLVLTLRVKNLSADVTFHPNDPAFHRAAQSDQPLPYTALEFHRKFFHGSFRWPPDPDTVKEYMQGHEADEQPLKPGEERDTWVAVVPWGLKAAKEDVLDAIAPLKPTDPLLWRVQLRRGLVKAPANGQEVELSATTVIGVEFRREQIK
jgi:hypothetical protein